MVDALQFAKYQALGNDFIVIDARGRPGVVDDGPAPCACWTDISALAATT
jgi:diaminopimelate epimerase